MPQQAHRLTGHLKSYLVDIPIVAADAFSSTRELVTTGPVSGAVASPAQDGVEVDGHIGILELSELKRDHLSFSGINT